MFAHIKRSVDHRKCCYPRHAEAPGVLNASGRCNNSSTETGVLVADHLDTARPLPKEFELGSENGNSSTFSSSMDVNNEFSFIGGMTSAFPNMLDFLYNNRILSRRILWCKSGHFDDPDSSPDVSLKSGRMVTLAYPFCCYVRH
ncbi:hypothetical protein AVEN_106956-1 [Araneus ventricosus]|uniref:Uncharacterized protein n=1 Tax=Araneus ventricosus TaxID=182803 RepID=A0A4Y2PMK2_ARAVE|nr:hypothetical protein AVEN_106956-1 [Araneus ventricosus]